VAFQTYHATVAGFAKSKAVGMEHQVKKAYGVAFTTATGTGEVRKQTAFKNEDYLRVVSVFEAYKANEAYHQGLADGMNGIASFISREFTARQIELATEKS
jgi:hypothetical protein